MSDYILQIIEKTAQPGRVKLHTSAARTWRQ